MYITLEKLKKDERDRVMMGRPKAIQHKLEGGWIEEPLKTGCAWCGQINGDTSHKFCATHRDKFYLDSFAHYLQAFDLSDEQIGSIKDRLSRYLDRIREKPAQK